MYTPGTVSPKDGQPLPAVPPTPLGEIPAVVARAREAQRAWAQLPLAARVERCMAFARRALEQREALAPIIMQETGRTRGECLLADGLVILPDYLKGAARAARKALAPEPIALSALEWPGKKVVVEAVPRGVVGIIAPWNYPFGNFIKPLFPALLAGNAVILKPSEHTPRTGAWLAETLSEVMPAGLVGLVQGAGEAGAALIQEVDAVTFTGSVRTGKKVAVLAAERLIPCSLELGGKDAAIVLADCDLERTVAGIAMWSFHNAGQNCAAIERVYVEEVIADRFVAALAKYAASLETAGEKETYDVGPLQNEAQLEIVETHVEDARANGAKVVAGGQRTKRGFGYEPTVIDHCHADLRVVREETFGPVVAVVRVKDAEEALRQANDSAYGLNGSVWTQDISRGEALARRMEVGVALVNNHSFTGALAETPWTGVKDTGTGVAASRHAYPTFVRRRTVVVDRSKKPDLIWYPADRDLAALGEAVAQKNLGRLSALFDLIRLSGQRVKSIQDQARRALGH